MTLYEIITAARNLLSEPISTEDNFPDDTIQSYFKDSTLTTYFNLEQQYVGNIVLQAYENYFTTSTNISTVNGTREYDLPSNFKKLIRLEDVENSNSILALKPITFNEKDNVFLDITATNYPCSFSILGNSLVLSPVPNASVTDKLRLWYEKRIKSLSSASSISEIPEEYHEILVWGVVQKAMFQQQGTGEAYVAARNEYQRLIAEMRKGLENRQVQGSRSVRRKKYIYRR